MIVYKQGSIFISNQSLINLPASGLLNEVQVLRDPGVGMGKARLATRAGNKGGNTNLLVDVTAHVQVERAARVTAADTRRILSIDAEVAVGDGGAVSLGAITVGEHNPTLGLVEVLRCSRGGVRELAPASGSGGLTSEGGAFISLRHAGRGNSI